MIVVHTNKSNFDSVNETGSQNMMANSFYGGKNIPLTWAIVREIDEKHATVTVQTDRGYMIPGVRVCVFGAYNHANKQGFSGKKVYPEIDSVVLVAFPSDGVPVTLGSAFFAESSADKNKLIDSDNSEVERTIKTAGWNYSYNQTTGSIELKDDNYIKDDDQKKDDAKDFILSFDKEKHTFNLIWWKKKLNFTIDENCGFTFSLHSGDDSDKELFTFKVADDGSKVETLLQNDNTKTSVTQEPGKHSIQVGDNVKIDIDGSSGSEKIKTTDGKNKLTFDAAQGTFTIEDGNKNKIESSSSGLKMSSVSSSLDLGSVIELKNTAGGLKSMIDDLWSELSDLVTACSTHNHLGSTSSGSPFAHNCTIVPDAGFAKNLGTIQTKKALVAAITK